LPWNLSEKSDLHRQRAVVSLTMRVILLKWLINALALLAASYLINGIEIRGPGSVILAAALLGILNALVRPFLILLTLPITIVTLGFFTLIINSFMLWLVSLLINGFILNGFWPAFWGALIISLVSWLLSWLFH
jgi:putative membrane protein